MTVGHVVVPDALGRIALSEEEKIGLSASTRVDEDSDRETDDGPEVALI